MRAYVHFNADPSVGMFPYGYTLEIPTFDEDCREQTREDIKKLYAALDGEFIPSWVAFSDENQNDD